MLMLRVMQRKGLISGEYVEYLVMGKTVPNPPQMTAKVPE